MIFLSIGLVLAIIVIVCVVNEIFETKNIRARIKCCLNNETQALPTVCAGHGNENIKVEERVVSLKYNTFKDENGNNLNIDDYAAYVVAGNSMQFCDIEEGNLLFASKCADEKDLARLPLVIVLSAPKEDPDLSQFKLRRAWRVCSDDLADGDYNRIISEILELDDFKQLKNDLANKGIHQTDEELIDDFFKDDGRLNIYKEKYTGVSPQNIVISTTYDTEKEKIHFSIHRILEVVGVKRYVYDIS